MSGSALNRLTMIRLGSQIRLSRREVERFLKITDIEPVGIRTIDDLEAYIAVSYTHLDVYKRQIQVFPSPTGC